MLRCCVLSTFSEIKRIYHHHLCSTQGHLVIPEAGFYCLGLEVSLLWTHPTGTSYLSPLETVFLCCLISSESAWKPPFLSVNSRYLSPIELIALFSLFVCSFSSNLCTAQCDLLVLHNKEYTYLRIYLFLDVLFPNKMWVNSTFLTSLCNPENGEQWCDLFLLYLTNAKK